MSKKFKTQASSSRAASSAFGGGFGSSAFGTTSSLLSYVAEPPDLTLITDPNVVVAFKNLSKKDSTTKQKALEDLHKYVLSSAHVEDAVIDAWTKIYPRISIDTSRTVRQLAHSLLGKIATASGKRIAKHLPTIIGPWLSGLFDTDKAAVKAAKDALDSVFTSPEKHYNLKKAYQEQILEYCKDVIDKESVLTLSDERTTSPDDAESKYARVIASVIGVIGHLLNELSSEDIAKQQSVYDEFLSSEKLWELGSYEDASVQRSVLRFLRVCFAKRPDTLRNHLDRLSRSFIANGLDSKHLGTSYDYVDALIALTKFDPSIWTDHYPSKKSPTKKLRSFLKKGSQGGSRDFWAALTQLVKIVPDSLLPKTASDATDFLVALHGGIVRKEEPRINLPAAFDTYVAVVSFIASRLESSERDLVLRAMVWPLFTQYLNPRPEESQWTIPGTEAPAIISKASTIEGVSQILEQNWPEVASNLIDAIKASAPEQSKDYARSQETVSQQGERWAALQGEILLAKPTKFVRDTIVSSSYTVFFQALEVLDNRRGKPYCAAAIVESLLEKIGATLLTQGEVSSRLGDYLQNQGLSLLLSPSMAKLVSILYLSHDQPWFSTVWTSLVINVIESPASHMREAALVELLSSAQMPLDFDLAIENSELQNFILKELIDCKNKGANWNLVSRTLKNSSRLLSPTTSEQLLIDLTQGLTLTDKSTSSLRGLEIVTKQSPQLLNSFLSNTQGSSLLQNLLLLTESADTQMAQEASVLNHTIQALLSQNSDDPASRAALTKVIQSGLSDATEESVTVETLVDIAQHLLRDDNTGEVASNILPPLSNWRQSLDSFLQLPPKLSLAITNPLGGALYLIPRAQIGAATKQPPRVSRDINAFSAAYRTASFLVKVFRTTKIADLVSNDDLSIIFQLLSLTLYLASDNLSLAAENSLWKNYSPDIEADVMEFVSDSHQLIGDWLQNSKSWWSGDASESPVSFVEMALQSCLENSKGTSATAFHYARVYSVNTSELIELHGWHSNKSPGMESTVRDLRKSKDIMFAAAYVTGHKIPLSTSKASSIMCNGLIAELTGLDAHKNVDDALRQLVLLNDILANVENIVETITKQRVVFHVQHLVKWLQDADLPSTLKAETCRALTILLPLMKDIYGEHWATILSFILSVWTQTSDLDSFAAEETGKLPLTHASMRLYSTLQSLTKEEEPNDDLLEAWKDVEDTAAKGLLNLLKHSQHVPDEFHQPLRIFNELLARLISRVPLKQIEEPAELFPLLYVASGPVQKTAFQILHKQIPAAQEQVSFDAALENKTAQLPMELLSLILEAPTVADLADADFTRSMPLPLRGYLFSWLLVFDHFENASYKVKTDYIEHLKEGNYLPGFLDFLTDFLGHGRGKPVDATKFDVTSYEADVEESPERDAQWLLTYLYFLCLNYTPSLAKSWWIDCKSRQKVLAVEEWTAKFITTHIISAALKSVSEWSQNQDASNPDEVLAVKVNNRAGEVEASYVIDDQTMAIRIRLPGTYPLHQATVEGISRVAVDERKWQSWLRNTQGVIAFSNGNLNDGLAAFRRNLFGTLKGQTECAICYSIISADKQLPTKKCSTCKNLFHTNCLYKWFKTSNASSCPLCRNLFHYG